MSASSASPRVALVTGANGGIGAAVARQLLARGTATHVALGIHSSTAVAGEIVREQGDRAWLQPLDVTQPGDWQAAVSSIVERHGRLDILVQAAGFHQDALLGTMAVETWSGVVSGNLDSVFHGCQAVVRTMMGQRHGRIVNVSSLSALLAPPGQTNYAAAKAGVLALTQSLAKEVARAGITVNAVCPGYIDTGALEALDDDTRRRLEAGIPMRRFGRPGEVAAAVDFLASEAASYISGAVLKIDGGIF
ncbi:MAG: SDR family NAD(P)-dependent oxidoreductase [Verrucomicrobiales bacterium]|nr:SDR family oxidoreductase [Akkermansiaceae bacterium]